MSRLECVLSDSRDVEICWMLDGQKLESEDGEASFVDGVARMVLEDAMMEDSGVYECVAKNKGGEARTSCNVTIICEFRTFVLETKLTFPTM